MIEIKFYAFSFSSFAGVRPFACPHCDKKFRTSGHRKTHITSHFKHTELRKLRHQRKPTKVRVGKSSGPVPDIPLQEPILITDLGKEWINPYSLEIWTSMEYKGHVLIKQKHSKLTSKDAHWNKSSKTNFNKVLYFIVWLHQN